MRIGIDIDGTICDSLTPWVNAINLLYGISATVEDITSFSLAASLKKFFPAGEAPSNADYLEIFAQLDVRKMEPYPYAVDVVRELWLRGHEIVYITARSRHSPRETQDWLTANDFLGDLVHTQRKSLVICDVLIDDCLENLKQYFIRFTRTLLIAPERHYTRAQDCECPAQIVGDWRDILNRV